VRTLRSRGWWVYLPAFNSRNAALGAARDLSAKGIRDYYVVTAGDQENTISLGLFRDGANAIRRRDELTALGFDAQLDERSDDTPEYWLDYAVTPSQRFDWRDRVPDRQELKAQSVPCAG
jgi:SPOR domain